MMGRSGRWAVGAAAVALALAAFGTWHCLTEGGLPAESTLSDRLPRIRPDYAGVVIPPNIAPLNFLIEEPGVEYRVQIHGAAGKPILIGSRSPSVAIPPRPWRELLEQNRGSRIIFDVYVRDKDARWAHFLPFHDEVASEEIDSHLVYRLLGPICDLIRDVGIYQRDLESFDESPLLRSSESFDCCMNCHSFVNNRPDQFAFQARPPGQENKGVRGGMYLVRNGRVTELKTESKAAPARSSYIAWHPNGSLMAFSMTKTRQVFHATGKEFREGYDAHSHLAILNIDTGAVSTSPGIADPAMQEAFPCWSTDGKELYFCRTRTPWETGKLPRIEDIKTMMYDLMRVKYDVDKDVWGTPETVLAASKTGMSIAQPRTSPDGRYLLFCMAAHGSFFPFQPSSDLYVLDLKSGKHRRLQCNSNNSEAWHCWSSNSRWIVFCSRRDDGWLARPYFCYIDANGREHKPFLLPQKDPAFYDTRLKTYNVPELITGPITISQEELVRAIRPASPPAGEIPQPIPSGKDAYRGN
jgi:hypothetical protein